MHTLLCLALAGTAASAEPLPGTQPLTFEGDPAAAMVAGIHRYLDRELAAAPARRDALPADTIEFRRSRLRAMLGVVDALAPTAEIELVATPTNAAVKGGTDKFRCSEVRWQALPGLYAEGYLLEPFDKPKAGVVAIPDANIRPEAIVGLDPAVPAAAQFARRLAQNGCRVLVPAVLDRGDALSRSERFNRVTNQSHREFVHRMAYEMGRTLIGYEVQKVLAGVAWLKAQGQPIGLYGEGEGGRIALYAAALSDDVAATAVVGGFGPREGVWSEPFDRNLCGCLTEFGDAEVARMARKPLFIAPATAPPPVAILAPGRRSGAAPGALRQVTDAEVRAECGRVGEAFRGYRPAGDGQRLLTDFLDALGAGPPTLAEAEPRLVPVPGGGPKLGDDSARAQRQFRQFVDFTQRLWRDSIAVDALMSRRVWPSPRDGTERAPGSRDAFWTDLIGKLPDASMPPNSRSRPILDEPKWMGYEVMLDVHPDVFAFGVLLVPKDLKPGERRPVVVCQHGLEGTPRSCIDAEPRPTYNRFAAKLADLGYVVYCPQNPYKGNNEFRQTVRKANPLKLSLYSFIVRQHEVMLDWLATLPFVDADRIAFYGLSYGGKVAMRIPPVLPRYAAVICSGDFNEWVGKCVAVDLDRSYMYSGEYDMYEFNLGGSFHYSDMAALICPRPFMVERGHDDGVGTDEMVAFEYAKVRRHYVKRGVGDRTAIEFFDGGHMVNGVGTFEFLKRHLGWPR
jgi:dienelactone hydrolase